VLLEQLKNQQLHRDSPTKSTSKRESNTTGALVAILKTNHSAMDLTKEHHLNLWHSLMKKILEKLICVDAKITRKRVALIAMALIKQ
jgi:hypothetical protein